MSNLPPGVTESMIPGNRPEDMLHDEAIEALSDLLAEHEEVLLLLGPKNLAYLFGKFLDVMSTVQDEAFKAGREEGKIDAMQEEAERQESWTAPTPKPVWDNEAVKAGMSEDDKDGDTPGLTDDPRHEQEQNYQGIV